jgi:hypothetical protein
MKQLLAVLCLVVPAFVVPVWAHHSMAGFDRTQSKSLEGVVKDFAWQNPHAWIELEVTTDGKTVVWNFEMTAPAYLVRAGWKKNTIKPGDKVTVVGNPLKTGEPGALFVSITLPDGTKMGERAAPAGKAAAK